jgi:hypothetical protein
MFSLLALGWRGHKWPGRSFPTLSRVVAAGLVVFSLMSPTAARADENAEARVYFEQGNRHLSRALNARGARKRRLLEQALDAYVSSLGIVRSRNVVYNAGIALEELRRFPEAFTYFQEYLAYPGISEDERQEATRRLDAIRPQVAVLRVTSTPAGAQVRVDRRDLAPRGLTPIEVAVSEGDHRIFLSMDGYESAELQAHADLGQRVELASRLRARPIPITVRAPDTGRLSMDGRPLTPGEAVDVLPGPHVIRYEPALERRIEVRPGDAPIVVDLEVPEPPGGGYGTVTARLSVPGRVTLDGAVIGEGSLVEARVSVGRHTLRVEAPGREPVESHIDVRPEEATVLEATLVARTEGETRWGAVPTVLWIGAAAAGVGAIAFGVRALKLKDDYDSGHGRDRDLFEQVERANLVADLVGAGALVLGATALGFTLSNEEEEQAPSTLILTAVPRRDGGVVFAEVEWGGL